MPLGRSKCIIGLLMAERTGQMQAGNMDDGYYGVDNDDGHPGYGKHH
jgi:hypothetical protein